MKGNEVPGAFGIVPAIELPEIAAELAAVDEIVRLADLAREMEVAVASLPALPAGCSWQGASWKAGCIHDVWVQFRHGNDVWRQERRRKWSGWHYAGNIAPHLKYRDW